jgi:hypothetical protein
MLEVTNMEARDANINATIARGNVETFWVEGGEH